MRPSEAAASLTANLRRAASSAACRPRAGGDVQLQQTGPGLGVDRLQLHPQAFEGRNQRLQQAVEAADLAQAVADARRQRPAFPVPDAHLVLETGPAPRSPSRPGRPGRPAAPPGKRAGSATRPANSDRPGRRPSPDATTAGGGCPGSGARSRSGAPGVDPVFPVVGDGHVHRIESQPQVGHHRPLLHRIAEGVGSQRLAADRAVHVGHAQQHEAVVGRGPGHAAAPFRRRSFTMRSTSSITPENRSIISGPAPGRCW